MSKAKTKKGDVRDTKPKSGQEHSQIHEHKLKKSQDELVENNKQKDYRSHLTHPIEASSRTNSESHSHRASQPEHQSNNGKNDRDSYQE